MLSRARNSSFLLLTVTLALASSAGQAAPPKTAVVAAPPTARAVTPAPSGQPQSTNPDLDDRLQNYFSQSRTQLGNLEPWQKRLFEDEALPDYQRFVRDYRSQGQGSANPAVAADIDFDTLKSFLRFYAPKSLKRENPTLLVVIKAGAECGKCGASVPEIKALIATRLEHRGLKPI